MPETTRVFPSSVHVHIHTRLLDSRHAVIQDSMHMYIFLHPITYHLRSYRYGYSIILLLCFYELMFARVYVIAMNVVQGGKLMSLNMGEGVSIGLERLMAHLITTSSDP